MSRGRIYRVHGTGRLLTGQAVDIVAPDVPTVGGFREGMKIANLADAFSVPVAMHNVASPVGTMASAHLGAAILNAVAVEFHSYRLGWWEGLVDEDGLIEGGRMAVPEEPGFGLSLDPDTVAANMVAGEELFDEA